jgi:hypothetical protein
MAAKPSAQLIVGSSPNASMHVPLGAPSARGSEVGDARGSEVGDARGFPGAGRAQQFRENGV